MYNVVVVRNGTERSFSFIYCLRVAAENFKEFSEKKMVRDGGRWRCHVHMKIILPSLLPPQHSIYARMTVRCVCFKITKNQASQKYMYVHTSNNGRSTTTTTAGQKWKRSLQMYSDDDGENFVHFIFKQREKQQRQKQNMYVMMI